jgi:NhaP-type Na+/H+ or K+/H+ antiporter
MLAYLLLRGKEFSVPDDVSTAIIGLFFGLLCGLFYYEHYYRQYYWAFSLGGGLILTYVSHWIFSRGLHSDNDTASIESTLLSFAVPFVLTLALNHGLYLVKRNKRKRRLKRKEHSRFFDTVDANSVHGTPSSPLSTHRRSTHK